MGLEPAYAPRPPTIHRSFFFLHGGLQHVLWRYLAMSAHATAGHHNQKDDELSQLSDYPLGRRSQKAAFRVSDIGAGFDSTAALRRLTNQN
jgi:hypothetical protein